MEQHKKLLVKNSITVVRMIMNFKICIERKSLQQKIGTAYEEVL